ncbi:hypothetical protein BH11ARM2_BH11ARM2_08770 [soil metagenome]
MSRRLQIQRAKELQGLCLLATLFWVVAPLFGLGGDTSVVVGNLVLSAVWLVARLRKRDWWFFAILRSFALCACLYLFPLCLLTLALGTRFGPVWITAPIILAAAYAFASLSAERPEVILWL